MGMQRKCPNCGMLQYWRKDFGYAVCDSNEEILYRMCRDKGRELRESNNERNIGSNSINYRGGGLRDRNGL
jgi:uncharacterized C2H2 Zn-finger protein